MRSGIQPAGATLIQSFVPRSTGPQTSQPPLRTQFDTTATGVGTGDSTAGTSGTGDASGRTLSTGDRSTPRSLPTGDMRFPTGSLGDQRVPVSGLGDQTASWAPPPGYEYVTGVRQRQQQCASPLPWLPFDQNFGYYLDPQTMQGAGYAGPGSEGVPFPVFAAWAAFLLGTAAGYKAIRRNYQKTE